MKLQRSTKRLLWFVAALPATMLVMATLYKLGMTYLEGSPRTLLESLQWAAETITTTGYGNDSHWQHPLLALFVILGQIMGQLLVFLIFPIFLLPYLEERFQTRLPRQLPAMAGKVLFYRHGPAIEILLEEFRRRATPFVIYEENLALAQSLRDQGYAVVYGSLAQDPTVLANVREARAVVTLADDHANARCTLLAREFGFTGEIFALAREPSRASPRISPPVDGLHLLGTRIGMTELRVRPDSSLADQRIGDLQLCREHGVTLIGQWHGGHFTTPQGPDTRLHAGAILVVAGAPERLERLERLAMPIRRRGPCIVAGCGAVGSKVAQLLRDAGETCTVIDIRPCPDVDILGNVLESSTLQRAGVREASAMILALSDDSETIFAAAAVRDHAPDVPLIVRVNRARNTERIYRTGVDFAISEGEVAGQILAFHLLGEQFVSVENGIRISRLSAGALAGLHLWQDAVRAHSGASIIAVVRDDEVLMDFDGDFQIHASDALLVCGTVRDLERFQHAFQPPF